MEVIIIKKLLVLIACCFLCMLTACASTDEPSDNANEQSAIITEDASDNLSTLEQIDAQLQGTWVQSAGQNPDGETVEFVYAFTDGILINDLYIGGEKVNNTKKGSYTVETDGIHTRLPRSKDSTEYLEGNIPYTFENGVLSLTPPEGSTISKIDNSASLQTESNGASNSDNHDKSSTGSNGSSSSSSATMGERQALKKAMEYLDYTAFSYSGLVNQLEYEGFTHSEAVYGADNCGADWNEQAARKAQEYIDYTSFSRDGLISQLEYEGFTHKQAEYGVTAVGY